MNLLLPLTTSDLIEIDAGIGSSPREIRNTENKLNKMRVIDSEINA